MSSWFNRRVDEATKANRSNFMHFLPSHPQPLSVASQRTVDVANMSNLVVSRPECLVIIER